MDLWPDLTTGEVDALGSILGGVGTVGTLGVSLWLLFREIRIRREDARKAQAQHIAAWMLGESTAKLANSSPQPVYRVIVWTVFILGAGPHTGEEAAPGDPSRTYAVLPPGDIEIELPHIDLGMSARPGLEIAFTDAAGLHWIRRSDGELVSIDTQPTTHYGIYEPQTWLNPT